MSWLFKFLRPFRARKLRFVGEQDGPSEQEFKKRIEDLLLTHSNVKAAYLAQVSYAEGTPHSAALCLSSAPDTKLLRELSQTFATMFNSREHLDILFLDEKRRAEVNLVCAPFYTKVTARR